MAFTPETASKAGKKSSRAGKPNKDTAEIREAFQMLVIDKLPQLSTWMDKVAEDNPDKALDLIIKFSDFVIPKLQRTEIQGDLSFTSLFQMSPEERQERIKELKQKIKAS